jgi:NAD(P)-dependent dehydrogenase (short-subunit alcohol dehydrogenase family)
MSPFGDSRVWFGVRCLAHLLDKLVRPTVTGSSQGIGRALIEAVLAAGERAVTTLRKSEVLQELEARYPPEQLLVARFDATEKGQIAEAFDATKQRFGRLDFVVNNVRYGLFGEVEGLEIKKQMEVLFWGPADISKQVSLITQQFFHNLPSGGR